jgi:simple sugar transport system permease protein
MAAASRPLIPLSADPTSPNPPAPRPVGDGTSGWRWRSLIERRETAIILVAAILFVYFSVSSQHFFGYSNFVNLGQFIAPIAAIGAGEVMLLVLGEIDLSAGTVFVFMPFITHSLVDAGLPLPLAVVVTVLVGGVVGAVNGIITVALNLPSFISTLGTLFALDGIMLVATHAQQAVMPGKASSGKPTTAGSIFGLWSWSEVLWTLAIVVLMYFLLHRTRFGMHTIAAGGNRLGAAEAGIPVRRVVVWCFVLSALLATVIGVIDGIRVGSVDPGDPGTTEMFYAVAAAVIGGTALTGGRGTQVGSVAGAIVLGVLYVGFTIKGINANAFILVLGVAILVAMTVNVQLARAARHNPRRRP